MTKTQFLLYKWEKVLYGGLLTLALFDLLNVLMAWENPVLRFTGMVSLFLSIVMILAHLFGWPLKEWIVTLYFIPLVLLAAVGIDSYYSLIDSLLAAGRERAIPLPIPHANYADDLIAHYISLAGPLVVRLSAWICRCKCN